MKTRLITSAILILFCSSLFSQKGVLKKTLKSDKQYLLYPVNSNTKRQRLEFRTKKLDTYLDIRLSNSSYKNYLVMLVKNITIVMRLKNITIAILVIERI